MSRNNFPNNIGVKHMRILVIEDEKLLADSIRTLLSSKEFELEKMRHAYFNADGKIRIGRPHYRTEFRS